MSDPNNVIAVVGLALTGAVVLTYGIADAVRDSDWLVIVRGITSGKRARIARVMRGVRRG